MDFGIIFLFIGGVLALIVGAVNTVHSLVRGDIDRKPKLFGLALGIIVMALFGRFLYQIFGLDENLVGAASSGDTAQVRSLLSRGADPNAQFEGATAEEEARRHGHSEIVGLLQRAGAKN